MKKTIILCLFILSYATVNAQSWQWVRTNQGTGWPTSFALSCDAAGNVTITGSYSDNVIFGSNSFTTASSDVDIFTASYNSAGAVRWAKRDGFSNALYYDYAYGICNDKNGNSYVAGYSLGSQYAH